MRTPTEWGSPARSLPMVEPEPCTASRRRRRRRWNGPRWSCRRADRSTSRTDSTSAAALLSNLLRLRLLPLFLGNLFHLLEVDEGALLVADNDVRMLVAVHVCGHHLRADARVVVDLVRNPVDASVLPTHELEPVEDRGRERLRLALRPRAPPTLV